MNSKYDYSIPNLADVRVNFETEIAQELTKRLENDSVYTCLGPDTLVYVNPLRQIDIFDREHVISYLSNPFEYYKTPHIYGFAMSLMTRMTNSKRDQSVVIM